MSFIDYFKDKYKEIILSIISFILVITLLLVFNINKFLILIISLILIINILIILFYNYIKRKIFYDNVKNTLNSLDQKYLITEMIKDAEFIDGKLFLDYLYEIDKSMNEYLNNYKNNSKEFIEYIGLWCHEIKIPLSTLYLLVENNKNDLTNSIKEEIDKIDSLIEQVLYFSRSDNVEKDYIIKTVNLKEIIDIVIKRNKKNLIGKKIKVNILKLHNVQTDIKWMEFIVNQIITNSIKYSKSINPYIEIYSKESKNNITLYIKDNGIGIPYDDLERVFDKYFTGSNGRKKYKSTGIGLYLCKKLCNKLGHNIKIESVLNEYTIISIIFPKSSVISEVINK